MTTAESQIFRVGMDPMGHSVQWSLPFLLSSCPRWWGSTPFCIGSPCRGCGSDDCIPSSLQGHMWALLSSVHSGHPRMSVPTAVWSCRGVMTDTPLSLFPQDCPPPAWQDLQGAGSEWPLPPSSVRRYFGWEGRGSLYPSSLCESRCQLSATALVRLQLTYMFWNIREIVFLFIEQ